MIMDSLCKEAIRKGPVCVGLDTNYAYLPKALTVKDMSAGEKVFEFNRLIIEATREYAACFKVQIACYEAMGMEGMEAFRKTVAYARGKGAIVITDAKRGDISSSAKQYAEGHFTGDFETDILTVNAYMGEDAVSPYYEYLRERNKGLFVLVKTSNPSGVDFQDAPVSGAPLYERVAEKVSAWGEAFTGETGFSSIGAVAGLTYPRDFARVKALMPHTFFLIPGYGAQGGTGKDIAEIFKDGICGVVNSSRGIIAAHRGKTEGMDFADHARAAAIKMKEDIEAWL